MVYTKEQLRKIYDRTSGYCHLCRKKLSFKNYGKLGTKAPWEIEHSKPKSKGGTDHGNNLYAACISCNRKKGNSSNYSLRVHNGIKKAPLSLENRKKKKIENALVGGVIGAVITGPFFGLWGAAIGSAIGANMGFKSDPDKE